MNGIVQISPVDGGSFLGYFGTNYTSLSPFQILQRLILTDAQRAQMLSNIPSTPTNLHIDEDGLIYTVTQGDKDMALKKLNIAGKICWILTRIGRTFRLRSQQGNITIC